MSASYVISRDFLSRFSAVSLLSILNIALRSINRLASTSIKRLPSYFSVLFSLLFFLFYSVEAFSTNPLTLQLYALGYRGLLKNQL